MYSCRAESNNGDCQLRFFLLSMGWYEMFFEFVPKASWTIEECALDQLDETSVEVDCNIGH